MVDKEKQKVADYTASSSILGIDRVQELIQGVPEQDQDGIVHVFDRNKVLGEDISSIGDPQEKAMRNFLKTVAQESTILGVAISRIISRGRGLYTTFLLKPHDKESASRVSAAGDNAFSFLNQATNEETGYADTVTWGGKKAAWFIREFHKPPKYKKSSRYNRVNALYIQGSSQDRQLLSLLMFEN